MSIQSQITKTLEEHSKYTLNDMLKAFPDINSNTIRSAYNRAANNARNNANSASGNKINMEMTEALLMKQLRKKPDTATLRLIMDFLKIKQQDHSELEEIDLSIFYKKAMED